MSYIPFVRNIYSYCQRETTLNINKGEHYIHNRKALLLTIIIKERKTNIQRQKVKKKSKH